MTVNDKSGRSMEIEFLGLSGDKVSFNRKSDGKRFELPLSDFDGETIKRLQSKKPEAGTEHPPYIVDVVIGKRRTKKNDSYYMVRQDVEAKVSIRNPDRKLSAPPATVRFVFIGEERRRGNEYEVLGVRDYQIKLAADATDTRPLDPVSTSYDSDNKGSGNIGGVQYDGYVLIISDEKGGVIHKASSIGKLASALRDDSKLITAFKQIKENARLDENYRPRGNR